MSGSDSGTPGRFRTPAVAALVDEWVANLAELLDSMTGQRPQVHWDAVTGSAADAGAGSEADVLWHEQGFQFSPEALVWTGAPRAVWEYAAALMLKAAGLELSSDDPAAANSESRKTWQEILGQWLSMLARSLSAAVGSEVVCAAATEQPPPGDQHEWATVSFDFGDGTKSALAVAFSAPLLDLMAAPSPATSNHSVSSADPPLDAAVPGVPPRTMELLLDVELPVSISFGKTELPLKEVLKLTTGSIVELNRTVNEPVEILVNHCLVARGEVVVVDGNYGVRVLHIISRQERLRSLH